MSFDELIQLRCKNGINVAGSLSAVRGCVFELFSVNKMIEAVS